MRPFLVLTAAFAAASSLCAAPIPIAGNGFLGDFTGDLSYDSGTSTLTVSLTNAATTLPGGKLTGFAFNLPTGVTVTGYSALGPNGTTFSLLGGPGFNNSVPVSPYGDADTGAALGGDWTGGGSPNAGLEIGETGTWEFQLAGMGSQTESDIFNSLTSGGGKGKASFLVRFKGFDNGGSDKVPGVIGDPPQDPDGDPDVVPEPATMVTLGILGAMGLVGYRLRKKKA